MILDFFATRIRLRVEDLGVKALLYETFSGCLTEDDQAKSDFFAELTIVGNSTSNRWSVEKSGATICEELNVDELLAFIHHYVSRLFVAEYAGGPAFYGSGMVKNGLEVIIAGRPAAGKKLLSEWLLSQDFELVSNNAVFFADNAEYHSLGYSTIQRNGPDKNLSPLIANLIIIPDFQEGAILNIEPLSVAQSILELTQCLRNSNNLKSMGLPSISSLAKLVPAIKVSCGDIEQLSPVFNTLLDLMAGGHITHQFLGDLQACSNQSHDQSKVGVNKNSVPEKKPVQQEVIVATPVSDAHRNKILTITMATYDDYDGVYFTIQSLRLHHKEVLEQIEIIIIDNNPRGACGQALRSLATKAANIRYIPEENRTGTAVRDIGFREAQSEFVLCVDCHVLIDAGAISKLISYYQQNPDTNDLIHGPMLDDHLTGVLTHFDPIWRDGMYGVWGVNEKGKNSHASPFEIPMQGLGLFSCRKQAWPGFNPAFSGFGGEEGYIHEKIRQAGGRVLCLPFLRWLHRFERPLGVPYDLNWQDRIVNYLIGFDELGLDTQQVKEHFKGFLNERIVALAVKTFEDKSKEI